MVQLRRLKKSSLHCRVQRGADQAQGPRTLEKMVQIQQEIYQQSKTNIR